MTIDQKLDVVKRALEMGASFTISFHNCRDQHEAVDAAKQFPELQPSEKSYGESDWLSLTNDPDFELVIFFDKEGQACEIVQ